MGGALGKGLEATSWVGAQGGILQRGAGRRPGKGEGRTDGGIRSSGGGVGGSQRGAHEGRPG